MRRWSRPRWTARARDGRHRESQCSGSHHWPGCWPRARCPRSPAWPRAVARSAGPARRRFSLNGVSATIDPRVDAVRGDLADVRLADRVFAPHYAAPLPRPLVQDAALRAARAIDSETLAQLHFPEFAGRRARDRIEELEAVGQLPLDEGRGQVRAQFIRRRAPALLEDHAGKRPFRVRGG